MGTEREPHRGEPSLSNQELERLLEERERLEALIRQKYTRVVTVMFTDMKGSTALAETEGDVVSRYLIKKNIDIVTAALAERKGVLVKTMGDGTLSWFERAQDAARTAIEIQKQIAIFNESYQGRTPLQLRIGINTGAGIVEKNDVFGDVVNVASRYETLAQAGEIYISDTTHDALDAPEEFYCRFIRTTRLKEKKGLHKVYKLFWDEAEIAHDKTQRAMHALSGDSEEWPTPEGPDEAAARPEDTPAGREILQQMARLEQEREFVALFFLAHEHPLPTLQEHLLTLVETLTTARRVDTNVEGKPAVWFYCPSITLGRFPEADVPLSNRALSRVPVRIGVREGQAWLTIEATASKDLRFVTIERGSSVLVARPGSEYDLGENGKIILAQCFPLEYSLHHGRLLILRVLDPSESLERNYHLSLHEIWPDFGRESQRLIVVGT